MMSSRSRSGSKSLAPLLPWKAERGDEDEVEQVREVAESEVAVAKVEKGDEDEGEKDDEESEESEDFEEWLHRAAWVCKRCTSTNMRVARLCGCCSGSRDDNVETKDGDLCCKDCKNLNFAHRPKCYWIDCPTNRWICPRCGNVDLAASCGAMPAGATPIDQQARP